MRRVARFVTDVAFGVVVLTLIMQGEPVGWRELFLLIGGMFWSDYLAWSKKRWGEK